MAQEEDGDRGTEKTHLVGGGKPASSSEKSSEPFFVLLDSQSSDPILPLCLCECKCCESAWEPVAEQGLGMAGLDLHPFPLQSFPPLRSRLLSPLCFSLCCICSSSWKSALSAYTPNPKVQPCSLGVPQHLALSSTPAEPCAVDAPGAHSLLHTCPVPILWSLHGLVHPCRP